MYAQKTPESLAALDHLVHEQVIETGAEFKRSYRQLTLLTGIPSLDGAIGGIPRHAITLLHGLLTSGMSTLAYRLIAEAQRQDQVIVYLDLSGTFDAEYAVAEFGLDESHFVLFNPADLADALKIVRDAITLPYNGVIVLDTVLVPVRQPALTSGLDQVRIPLRQSQWTIIGLLPLAIQSLCQPYAALQLSIHRKDWLTRYRRVTGFESSITTLKHRSLPRRQSVTFDVHPLRA